MNGTLSARPLPQSLLMPHLPCVSQPHGSTGLLFITAALLAHSAQEFHQVSRPEVLLCNCSSPGAPALAFSRPSFLLAPSAPSTGTALHTSQQAHPGALPPTGLSSPASFSHWDTVLHEDSGPSGQVHLLLVISGSSV